MAKLPVFDVKLILFEFPSGCSVVKGGADAAGIVRKRKHAYLDCHRKRVNQVPNKTLGCIPTHADAKELDSEFQETKQADSSLFKANLAENTPRKRRKKKNKPKD